MMLNRFTCETKDQAVRSRCVYSLHTRKFFLFQKSKCFTKIKLLEIFITF